MKIFFYINTISSGAERVLTNLATEIDSWT